MDEIIQRNKLRISSLAEALEEIAVVDCDMLEPNNYPQGWVSVIDTDGVIAAFSTESQALFYRLMLINLILNS